MPKTIFLRACPAAFMLVTGSLQAWDSAIADSGMDLIFTGLYKPNSP